MNGISRIKPSCGVWLGTLLRLLVPPLISVVAATWIYAADTDAQDVIKMEQVIVEATRVDAHPSLFGRHNVCLLYTSRCV